MDRENANFDETLRQVQADARASAASPSSCRSAARTAFQGVVDLIEMKAYMGDKATRGGRARRAWRPEIETPRATQLLEAVAENDEDLLNKYLEGEELTPEEMRKGLAAGIAAGDLVPGVRGVGGEDASAWRASWTRSRSTSPRRPRRTVEAPTRRQRVELKADASGPLAAQVFKTTADPYVGKLTYLRVFSGTLKADSHVWNANKQRRRAHRPALRGARQDPGAGAAAGRRRHRRASPSSARR